MSIPQRGNQTVNRLRKAVGCQVNQLQNGYLANQPRQVADLAKLRRGVGRDPDEVPLVFALAVAGLFDDDDDVSPRRDIHAETAAFLAVTLYALHQQSRRDQKMHVQGYSFGRSVRLLMKRRGDAESIRRRFEAAATANPLSSFSQHARSLVQQFRQARHGVPMDYVQFAEDLYWLQSHNAGSVRRRWGVDFYRLKDEPEQPAADAVSTTLSN